MSKINKIKKSSSKRYNNHFSDELVKILTADSILSDVYLGNQHLQSNYKPSGRRNIDRSSDNYLVYCTSCKKIWENHYSYNPTIYHDNIPTYGKKRLDCKPCRKEMNEQNR